MAAAGPDRRGHRRARQPARPLRRRRADRARLRRGPSRLGDSGGRRRRRRRWPGFGFVARSPACRDRRRRPGARPARGRRPRSGAASSSAAPSPSSSPASGPSSASGSSSASTASSPPSRRCRPRCPRDGFCRRRLLSRALVAAAALLAAALREVAEQLAGDRGRLSGHPHPGAAQDLLGLRRVRDGGGEQGDGEAAVLAAGGLDEAAGVLAVGAAGGVDEEAEQALRLRPAGDRVLLVRVAGELGEAPDPGLGLVAAADPVLGERLQEDPDAGAALIALPGADHVDRLVERLGLARWRRARRAPSASAGSSGCAGCR